MTGLGDAAREEFNSKEPARRRRYERHVVRGIAHVDASWNAPRKTPTLSKNERVGHPAKTKQPAKQKKDGGRKGCLPAGRPAV